MATYKMNVDTASESIVYTVAERNIYGSDRLGMYTYPDTVYPVPPASTSGFQPVWRGYRKYELKNHLGNVTSVINGHKIPVEDNGNIAYYTAQIEAAYDYSPFGVTRLSFEPNYTPGSPGGEAHPLKPDFMWCLDGDGIEKYGSGHDATLYNMTTTADRNNQTGKALESAGNANSYMEIAHHADLVFEDNDFTVGIWVKRLALNNNWNHTVAAGKWHSGQEPIQNEWYLAISNGGSGNHPPQFAIQAGSTKYTAGGTAVPVGDWYHLMGVREGDNIKLYVDGVLVDTEYVGAAVVNTIPSRNIFLGLMGNGKFLKAGFDEFVVYHRALTATEVGDLYEMGCDDFDTESGVLAEGGYRYGFMNFEKDDEVKGAGNHISFGDYGYDPRLGRRWNIDPIDQVQISNFSVFKNNPIYFVDKDGNEPREGNQVISVDFNRSFITLVRDDSPKFKTFDPHLRSSASDRLAHVTSIGPLMRGPYIQKKFFEFKKYHDILEGSALTNTDRAYTWLQSAKSSTGYQYVEFDIKNDQLIDIRRDVINLNEQLGVSGFENVVRHKQIFATDNQGKTQLSSEEFWSYRTVETETGDKRVEYEHIKIDMKPGGKMERSGWQTAEPAKYDPDEE